METHPGHDDGPGHGGRGAVEAGRLALHGWHYVIEDGEVHVFDVRSGSFVPASNAEHSGDGPFDHALGEDGSNSNSGIGSGIFNEIDDALAPVSRRLVGDQGGTGARGAT
jgi:carbonic anhydrase